MWITMSKMTKINAVQQKNMIFKVKTKLGAEYNFGKICDSSYRYEIAEDLMEI